MYYIDKMPNVITIGRVGENNFRTLQIDMTEWMKDMPNGTPSIVVIRPEDTEDDAYIAATTFVNNILTWVINASDTANTGTGTMQVWLEEVNDGAITRRGKNAIVAIRIYESITNRKSTPSQQQPWMDQMTSLKSQTVVASAAAQTAQAAAEAAQEAAEIAAGIAITQAGQINLYIDEDGHLIFAYTDQVPVNEEDE